MASFRRKKQKVTDPVGDMLLINNCGGRDFGTLRVRAVVGGGADDVVLIDLDEDGTTGSLTLNRIGGSGHIQLVAVVPEPPWAKPPKLLDNIPPTMALGTTPP